MVPFILIGVQDGEPADRGSELGVLPDVAADCQRVAGAGVRPGECLAAGDPGDNDECRCDPCSRDDASCCGQVTAITVTPTAS